MKKKKKSRD